MEKMWDKTEENISIPATDMEHYAEHPDVIFVCVKGYSLQETIPFIKRIARKNTIVIPVLNIYGTGGKMQKELPDLLVTDGCIYVSANIKEPGKTSPAWTDPAHCIRRKRQSRIPTGTERDSERPL